MSIKVCLANIKYKLSDLVASTNCTIPKKIPTEGGWGHTFFGKPSGICRFDTLPLDIPYKTKLHPWKFHKIVLYHLTWAIPEKIQTGEEFRIYFFEPLPPPTLELFIFLLYPWKFQAKQSSTLGYSTKLCKIPWKFQGQKQRLPEIPHYSFLVTLGNSTLFIINPWKFHMLFLWYPWKLHILNIVKPHPFLFDFFWNSPLEIPRARTKALWKFHMSFFLIIPGNFTPFLIDTWNFHILFFLSTSTPHPLIMFGFVLE